jgi:cytidylate kinase
MSKSSHDWVRPDFETRTSAHVRAWEKRKQAGAPHRLEALPFITISRQYGCEGAALAHRLVEILNERSRDPIPWVCYDHELLEKIANDRRLYGDVVESLESNRRLKMTKVLDAILDGKASDAAAMRKEAEVVRALALHGRAVLLGRGSYLVTQDLKTGLHVRLIAPVDWRVIKITATRGATAAQAVEIIMEGEDRRDSYMREHFAQHGDEAINPDLVLDNSRFNLVQISDIVLAALRARFGE